MTSPGLFQQTPLTLRMIFDRMRMVYAEGEIVSPETRRTYGESADRVLRLTRVLRDDLGILPHPKWDERPVAAVVPGDPSSPPTLEDVKAFLADRVATWWLPDELVTVDEIPRTSVGRLDKKVLRAQLGDLDLRSSEPARTGLRLDEVCR